MMATRSACCDMRWLQAFLIVAVLMGCGSGRGLSRNARLDGAHYTFGPHVKAGAEPTRGVCEDPVGNPAADLALAEAPPVGARSPMPHMENNIVVMTGTRTINPPVPEAAALKHTVPERDRMVTRKALARGSGPEEVERTKWNLFALVSPVLFIAAVVAAILSQSTGILLVGCAIAFVAALIGVRQCRERGERGQGFAMAVIGFALAGSLVAAIALLTRL